MSSPHFQMWGKMRSEKDEISEKPADSSLGRRELMKIGAGAFVASAISAPAASVAPAELPQNERPSGPPAAPGSMRKPGEIAPFSSAGYKNPAERLAGNGPMDDTTARIVKWVRDYDVSQSSPATIRALNRTMLDSMSAIVAGFEEEPCRIAARVARLSPPGEMKCTVLGYGVETTPELATFANGCLIREVDFNDMSDEGGHVSTLIPAAMAIGEALHCSGSQVMESIIVGYEVAAIPAGGEAVVAAMVAGKLMKLDEDRLANALTMALTPHVALNKGVGVLSMWKGTRSAESAKCGIWAAILAREGMTGPPQPFEGVGGFWHYQSLGRNGNGMGREFTIPAKGSGMAIERNWFKRRPAEASSQGLLMIMPEIRAWVKPDEVASIHWDTPYGNWEEICDNPKWDPTNRETADHSLPYIVARALMDGDVYLDSFLDRSKVDDPAVRALMAKITMAGVSGWESNGQNNGPGRLTVVKKSGETKYFDTYNGVRALTLDDHPPFTEEEMMDKWTRVCGFKKVDNGQRDRAYKLWTNLSAVRDFGDAMKSMAKFGQPRPL
jgi:2-methylcitrate dehydratase